MFTLYCDDSGTHKESPIAIAACLVSTVDKWDQFLKAWCSASMAEQFGVFHRADFEGNYPPFDSIAWKDKAKKERTLNRLITNARPISARSQAPLQAYGSMIYAIMR
jgi:hypothetical protein